MDGEVVPDGDVRHGDALARLRAAYDADAERRAGVEPEPWRLAVVDELAASLPRGGRVVELGCGAGQLARRLADAGLAVTAVDLSPAMVERTAARGVDALVADLRTLPFGDAAFDGALAFNSFLHTPRAELSELFAEVRRVLVAGAPLTVVVWGGVTRQGPLPDDWLDPPRFYSTLSDDDLLALPTPGFERRDVRFLHDHATGDGLHHQVLSLRVA